MSNASTVWLGRGLRNPIGAATQTTRGIPLSSLPTAPAVISGTGHIGTQYAQAFRSATGGLNRSESRHLMTTPDSPIGRRGGGGVHES